MIYVCFAYKDRPEFLRETSVTIKFYCMNKIVYTKAKNIALFLITQPSKAG